MTACQIHYCLVDLARHVLLLWPHTYWDHTPTNSIWYWPWNFDCRTPFAIAESLSSLLPPTCIAVIRAIRLTRIQCCLFCTTVFIVLAYSQLEWNLYYLCRKTMDHPWSTWSIVVEYRLHPFCLHLHLNTYQ